MKRTIFRILSTALGVLFLATAPLLVVAGEGAQKFGAIPVALFGTLFILKAYRWE